MSISFCWDQSCIISGTFGFVFAVGFAFIAFFLSLYLFSESSRRRSNPSCGSRKCEQWGDVLMSFVIALSIFQFWPVVFLIVSVFSVFAYYIPYKEEQRYENNKVYPFDKDTKTYTYLGMDSEKAHQNTVVLNIAEGVTNIPARAFYGLEMLKTINGFPSTLTEFGKECFRGCLSLEALPAFSDGCSWRVCV